MKTRNGESNWHCCDAPLNFANFDLKFYLVFEPDVHINGRPALFEYFFRTSCGRFCIFSDRCTRHISRTKKEKTS